MHLADLFREPPHPPATIPPWPRLLAEAAHQMVLPALWSRLPVLGLLQTIPYNLLEVIQSAAHFNAERNSLFIAEFLAAAKILNSIGIEPVALKGIAYLLSGALTPESRYLDDIDLLIPASRLQDAIRILNQNGFPSADPDALQPFRRHAAPLQRPFAPTIELHHSLGMGTALQLLPATEVLRDATPLHINSARFQVPSPTHLVSHLVLHSQILHAYHDRVFPPLRALLDLRALTQNPNINWPSLIQRYRTNRQYLTLALHLKQADRTIGLPPPQPLPLSTFGKLRWRHRTLLNQFPLLRLVDPAYLGMSLFSRRLQVLRLIAKNPTQWTHLAKAAVTPKYYRNLFRL